MGGRGGASGLKHFLNNEGGNSGPVREIDISKIKDQSLEGIEKRIRNLNHEELYVFDKNGNLVAGYRGNKTSVSFPESLKSMEGATVTHGHPKGMKDFGGTFSFADMKNMLASRWAEHRATASGQGEMNYILRRTSKSNASGFSKQISKDQGRLEKSLVNTYNKTYKTAISSGKSVSQARHVARQKAVGELNAYYKKTAPKYGYEYVTRKKSYKYNR